MSHYKPYPAYKDSGVEWLGHLPEHWKVGRLKQLLLEIGSGGTPDTDNPTYWSDSDEGIPWVAIGDMSEIEIVSSTAKKLTAAGLESKRLRIWPSGTLLFSMYASLGHTAELEIAATTNQAILCLVPKKNLSQRYLLWWLQYLKPNLREQASSNTQDNLNAEKVRNLVAPHIPLEEQKAIAAHLDRETTRIDALITKKTRFIELLREKRQALITHAVTKGLDPSVKMKDSGVEWLGEVPEHWGIQPLKQLARLDGGAGFPDDEQGIQDAPIPFFKVADLSNGMTSAENYITPETAGKLRAKIFPAGTIAFAKVGAALLLNRRVLMPIPGCADNNMMVAIPHGILGTWLHAVLSCYDMAWLVNPGAVPSVNQEQVGNIKIPVPSVEEQRSIVASVSSGTMRIDRIVGKTERSIELLKERRTALITAAVTGQIDLRELSA